jgi:hypothetical protein
MGFTPVGGFISIVRTEDTTLKKNVLENRGFSSTNIVSIAEIMNYKKKKDILDAFGQDNVEAGILTNDIDLMDSIFFSESPNSYDGIEYKKVPNNLKVTKK